MNEIFFFSIFALICGCSQVYGLRSENAKSEEENLEWNKLLSKGCLSFAVDLISNLHHSAAADDNLIISPINIYAVLAMAHLGSSGETREALAETLGLPKNETEVTKVHEAFGKLLERIVRKEELAVSDVTMANGLFVQKGYPLLSSYTDQIKKYYGNEVGSVDFQNHPKDATDLINKWVSEKTKGRISQLYSMPLDSLTRIILAASLYFNGRWTEKFPVHLTKPEKFNTGVKNIEVQMMNHVDDVPYYDNPQLQFEAISLSYDGYEYFMTFFLPYQSQTLKNLTNYLKPQYLKEVFDNVSLKGIDYKIPRMKFSWKDSLIKPLSIQGLKGIFEKSDLRNMISTNDLQISDIHHAAEIEVDESGTVASAISTLQIQLASLPVPPYNPKPFIVNRPYMAAIYHRPTETILFLGMVHQPTVSN